MSIASAARMTVISEQVDATVDRFIGVVVIVLFSFSLFKFPDNRDNYENNFYTFGWGSFTRKGYCIVASR